MKMKTKSYRNPQQARAEFVDQLASYLVDHHPSVAFGDQEDCAEVFGSSIDELLCWPDSGYTHFAHSNDGSQGCASLEEAVWAALALAGVDQQIDWSECESCKGGWHYIEWEI
jgi:hypothetical protein